MNKQFRSGVIAGLVLMAGASGSWAAEARATTGQEAAGVDAPVSRLDLEADPESATRDGWQGAVGLGVAVMPDYPGAEDYRVRPLPLLEVSRGRFFAGTLRGIGVDLSPVKSLRFGPRLGFRPGRDQDDSSRLAGMGDIDNGATLGVFFEGRFAPEWLAFADVRAGVGNDDAKGVAMTMGAAWDKKFGSRDRLRVAASIDFADADHMQTWFGVSPAQSVASGLPVYSAGAGARDTAIGAVWTHSFDRHWFTVVTARVSVLLEDAQDSPLVEEEFQFVQGAMLGYRF